MNVFVTGCGRKMALGFNFVRRYLEQGDNVIATVRKSCGNSSRKSATTKTATFSLPTKAKNIRSEAFFRMLMWGPDGCSAVR